jgi:hypothetical protein
MSIEDVHFLRINPGIDETLIFRDYFSEAAAFVANPGATTG